MNYDDWKTTPPADEPEPEDFEGCCPDDGYAEKEKEERENSVWHESNPEQGETRSTTEILASAIGKLQESVAANIRTDEKLLHLCDLLSKRIALLEGQIRAMDVKLQYYDMRITVTQEHVAKLEK